MEFFLYVLVGFIGQMIDGSLGMAYGVSCNAFLLSLGIPPAASSASVHAAEVVVTGISGLSHFKFGNVDKALFLRLIIPGTIGGGLGAYVLTQLDGSVIKPYISIYLLLMGFLIIYKGVFKKPQNGERIKRFIIPLAVMGGTCDAIGGGGWGPVVTTTLIAGGNQPRETIGSVNASEFFVSLVESVVFILTLGLTHWMVILGLLIGGIIAAPLAAYLTKRLPVRALMVLVGLLIVVVNTNTIVKAFF
ncbi:MAG TPA: sulfite exporter TauE/SafE family protein [Anaerolineaceae bacterium]|nr:sulfite exporter TauE/SafE family protein [Anaerolineaceae bacterium]HPN52209.1 sulfite exporter TauE/SafE family protein [Anaerolineaceae bacterium]